MLANAMRSEYCWFEASGKQHYAIFNRSAARLEGYTNAKVALTRAWSLSAQSRGQTPWPASAGQISAACRPGRRPQPLQLLAGRDAPQPMQCLWQGGHALTLAPFSPGPSCSLHGCGGSAKSYMHMRL
jgi:hypothetical protein